MLLVYNIFIRLYSAGISIASLWNKKAKEWKNGRKDWAGKLAAMLTNMDKVIWMHCSSAGEFEQGKPVIEALKKAYPSHKILISFFSPSGYQVATKYTHADFTTYLPLDTRKNSEQFLRIVKPQLVIFVKYEFWYHHLSAAAHRHTPIFLISATFRYDQVFFRSYGGFFKQILFLFRHIFVQDESSLAVLNHHGITHASISGDTRFDRVSDIASNFSPIPVAEKFLQNSSAVIAGSTWPDDEALLKNVSNADGFDKTKLVIAPHEISEEHLKDLVDQFPDALFFSSIKEDTEGLLDKKVLIIDNVGMLSRLYKYASVAYIGGGFTRDGIHNILEAAVWGKPVVFGPNYQKYREAKELIEAGGGFSVKNADELKQLAGKLMTNEQYRQAVGEKAKNYVFSNTGATEKILQEIQAKRLLTN